MEPLYNGHFRSLENVLFYREVGKSSLKALWRGRNERMSFH